ncbi:hypothetical protein [uncultured Cyclobacterium sp.]|uniref:hypothetical protein n=1 Tax=uncultured Cyclobacterium sp. TaxID=453820 RepID=UPI0030EC8E9C
MKDTSSLNTEGVEQLLVIPDETKVKVGKGISKQLQLPYGFDSAQPPVDGLSRAKSYRLYWDRPPFFPFKGDFDLSALL